MFKQNQFPVQAKPIYQFTLTPDGIARTEHRTYTSYQGSPREGKMYRIHTGDHIVVKSEHQLDVCRHNRIFTFCDDMGRAQETMLAHYNFMADKAALQLKQAEDAVAVLTRQGNKP